MARLGWQGKIRHYRSDAPLCSVTTKVTHLHRRDAETARRAQYQRGQVGADRRLSVYVCRHCGGWHVGSTRPSGARSR